MTEQFDAVNPPSPSFQSVLAEALRHFIGSGSAEFQQRNRAYFDRLAAAHNEELRSAAAEVEAADRAVGLLRELRAARPLLAYGDIWIERIDAFLSEQTKSKE